MLFVNWQIIKAALYERVIDEAKQFNLCGIATTPSYQQSY